MQRPFYSKSKGCWVLESRSSTGKRSYKRIGKDRKEAEVTLASMEASRHLGSSLPACEAIRQFLAFAEQQEASGAIKETTLDSWRYYLSLWSKDHPDIAVRDVKPIDVMRWLDSHKRWQASSRRQAAISLRRAFSWAAQYGLVDSSPLVSLRMPSAAPRDFLVSPELHALLVREVVSKPHRASRRFAQVLIGLKLSGCRPNEICSVDLAGVDEDTWTLRRHKNEKRTKKARVVYMNPCLRTLTRILKGNRTEGPLFSVRRKPWTYSMIRRRFERLKKKLKAPEKCVLYAYRHTWITRAMENGVDLATVAELSGTSIEMISRHYGHLSKRKEHLLKAAIVSVSYGH